MDDELPALAGFEQTPPHVLHVLSGARIWFTEPLGILTQIAPRTIADEQMGAVLTGMVTQRLFELRGSSPAKLYFTHDWSRMEGYTTQARSDLTAWGVGLRNDIERLTVVLSPSTKPIVRMGVDVAGVAFRLAGIRFQVAYDPAALVELGLRPNPRVGGTIRV